MIVFRKRCCRSAWRRKECRESISEPLWDMYEGVRTSVRSTACDTEYFPIDIGLHQGLAVSPFLFAIIMDELTREIQDEVPLCMLFADDIILIDETGGTE